MLCEYLSISQHRTRTLASPGVSTTFPTTLSSIPSKYGQPSASERGGGARYTTRIRQQKDLLQVEDHDRICESLSIAPRANLLTVWTPDLPPLLTRSHGQRSLPLRVRCTDHRSMQRWCARTSVRAIIKLYRLRESQKSVVFYGLESILDLRRYTDCSMNYFSSMVTILIVLSMRSPVYATALEAEDEGSPQYLYMERLRKVTRTMPGNMDITGEDSAQTPGTLLATSFKDSSKYLTRATISGCIKRRYYTYILWPKYYPLLQTGTPVRLA